MAATLSYTKMGPEFLVNTIVSNSQGDADAVALANGAYVVTWADSSTSAAGVGTSIKAQVFTYLGQKFGGEFQVNTSEQGNQTTPKAAALATGNYVITWTDDSKQGGDASNTSIKAQILTPSGAKVGGEILVNTVTSGIQQDADIAGLPNGGFLATWTDFSLGGGPPINTEVKAQIFDAAGAKVGSEFTVATQTASSQGPSQIAAFGNGTFAISWLDASLTLGDSSGSSIKAQVFNQAGTKIGGEFLVNTVTTQFQFQPSLMATGDGIFLASWVSWVTGAGNSDNADIKARAFTQNGQALGASEILVNTQTQAAQFFPASGALADGGMVFSWTDLSPTGDGSLSSVKYQLYTPDAPIGTESLAATNTTDTQSNSTVAGSTLGGFMIAWTDYSGTLGDASSSAIKAQMFQPVYTGTVGDDAVTAPKGPSVINLSNGIDTVTFDFALIAATVSYQGNRIVIDTPTSHAVITGAERFVFTDGTVDNADGDRLVDDLFYYSRYPDVWNAHLDADAHYHASGRNEDRDPSAFFDTSFYLSVYQDVKASGADPLVQFDTAGWKQGRMPSPAFDAAAYLQANPDVAAIQLDPLLHYLQYGYQEGRAPIAGELIAPNGFDYGYYLAQNPDVAAAGVDPFQHFQDFGWKEGRKPNSLFDTSGYLATYTDVRDIGINPLDHYHQFGWHEGRDPSVSFDSSSYLAAYPDVANVGIDPLVHFLDFGVHEGRLRFADATWG